LDALGEEAEEITVVSGQSGFGLDVEKVEFTALAQTLGQL
jgi:hypothetical protein